MFSDEVARGAVRDPSLRSAPAASLGAQQERFELIDIDTLFYIDNNGLTRILADLNGHRFKLVTDPAEVQQSTNAFLIPQFGEITIHIGTFIKPDEDNYMEVLSQGPEGSTAELVIGDLLLPGQEVAYAVANLQELPHAFALLQSYPNPFQDHTTITFTIPENRTSGVPVYLAVHDVMGRRVRVLVEAQRFPGRFEVQWDGTNQQGQPVAGGLYFCQMVAGEVREAIEIIRVR